MKTVITASALALCLTGCSVVDHYTGAVRVNSAQYQQDMSALDDFRLEQEKERKAREKKYGRTLAQMEAEANAEPELTYDEELDEKLKSHLSVCETIRFSEVTQTGSMVYLIGNVVYPGYSARYQVIAPAGTMTKAEAEEMLYQTKPCRPLYDAIIAEEG